MRSIIYINKIFIYIIVFSVHFLCGGKKCVHFYCNVVIVILGYIGGDKWLTQNTGRYGYNYSEGNPLEVKKEKQRKQVRFKSVSNPLQNRCKSVP